MSVPRSRGLKSEEITLTGDVIPSVGEIAAQRGVAPASIRIAMRDSRLVDHVKDQTSSSTISQMLLVLRNSRTC